ncbi:MAG: hypothetical protein JWN43_589, partial [Gammaproteobacteria bacterium]|nr:hypothetical protein [Gammaproteobacteria bacterium]
MKSLNCIPSARSAAAWCGVRRLRRTGGPARDHTDCERAQLAQPLRPAGKLGAAHENSVVISALVACVLVNGSAVAQGQPAATRQPVVPASATTQQPSPAPQSPVVPQKPTAAQSPTWAQLPALDACLARLDPELDIGYDRIAARCPDLVKQLDHGTWVPWLPHGWKESGNDLSAGGLKEFRELVERESAASASPRAPDIRHLKGVLNGLGGTSTGGWWSRFKAWLRSILETREQPTDDSWFTRMVSHVGISQSLRQLIAYAALTAVVLLAAVIVINEVR